MIAKLEMLIALAKEQHFGKAALSLGIAQPSLSSGIRQLEDQLGVKLVQRGARFGGLTPEGQRALVWARQIVGDSRRLRDEMRASKGGLSGHLRIAVIPTALTWAAHLTARFTEKHPNVAFSVLSASSRDILDRLENLDIDAGISYLDNEPLGRVTTAPLYTERYSIMCGARHPLGLNDKVTWRDVAAAKLCLLTPDMQNRRIIDRNFMEAGVSATALIESNSTVVLASMVESGEWVTILPQAMAEFLAAGKGTKIVPIEKPFVTPSVGLIAPFQEPYTPVISALLDMARQIAVD